MDKLIILLLSFSVISCGPTLVTTGAKTAVEQQSDDKTMRESWDDATIKLGIKEKYFSYDATLLLKLMLRLN